MPPWHRRREVETCCTRPFSQHRTRGSPPRVSLRLYVKMQQRDCRPCPTSSTIAPLRRPPPRCGEAVLERSLPGKFTRFTGRTKTRKTASPDRRGGFGFLGHSSRSHRTKEGIPQEVRPTPEKPTASRNRWPVPPQHSQQCRGPLNRSREGSLIEISCLVPRYHIVTSTWRVPEERAAVRHSDPIEGSSTVVLRPCFDGRT